MAGPEEPRSAASAPATKSKRRGLFPPEIIELMKPSLMVGAVAGTGGAALGVSAGIQQNYHPAIGGIANGTAFFLAGTGFWLTRSMTLRAMGCEEDIRPSRVVLASAGAGSTSGAIYGLMRGPSNILPSIIVWGAAGAGGQWLLNITRAYMSRPKAEGESKLSSWLRKWSPIQKLTNEEYIDMLKEKKLKFDTEIALIDDKIAEIRAAHPGLGEDDRHSSASK